jgi:serine/threonine-protein kinase
MPFYVGDKLGPYEILSLVGKGGMGEVYRAHDSRLRRDVAIKVLPETFARDPERMARFQREAEVLASLNHPNIAAIYGVEARALVMELVEGESPKGPLPFDDAWKIASQIAGALEYAHEKGVVHRDLKPANIKVTPEGVVKILDFGLAKAFTNRGEARTSPPDIPENSPTLTLGATEVGVILGTAAYMPPEQAKGKTVDKRADIWSFGVVLYELLTAERLFKGEDVSETLAQVLTKQPDWEKVPPKARRLLRDCLEKDPKQRLRDIGDAKRLVGETEAATASSLSPSGMMGRLGWIVAGLLAVATVVGLAGWYRAAQPLERPLKPLVRLDVDLGPDALATARFTAAISPDGTRIVYPARSPEGKQQLATRLLDQANSILLSGTEGGTDPFFSPDGQWIGFFAAGKMNKISVQGGSPVMLCEAPSPWGASWGEDGNIIAALANESGLTRVPSAGGKPQRVTQLGDQGELTHRWPQILPGGGTVLFTASTATISLNEASIDVLSLRTGKKKILVSSGYFGRYVPANESNGYLIYIHDGSLFGVHFDPIRRELKGTPSPLLGDVPGDPITGAGQFDDSLSGTFVYRSGRVTNQSWPIVWLDSSGKTQPLLAKLGFYTAPRISPDGKRLTFRIGSSASGGTKGDVFVYDTQRDTLSRLTFTNQTNFYPTWAPDGKHIVFRSPSVAGSNLQWIRADGAGEAQRLLEARSNTNPYSFSPDGRRLAYGEQDAESGSDLWTLPLDLGDSEHPKPGKPELFLRTPANESLPAFSTDGRWIAYRSDESGSFETYVRPFPGPGGKWQISTGGGQFPIWSRNGRELFYETPDNHIMVVDYTASGDSFTAGKPRLWSDKQIRATGAVLNYDLAPDGKRFAVFPMPDTTAEEKGNVHVTFLLNFFDELRRKVPVDK